ncbi:MAG: hypothetical protein SH818_00425 [Saprospiraceae bacterium]|nr:hypothetical protein [Saprospiraceae bacterium]
MMNKWFLGLVFLSGSLQFQSCESNVVESTQKCIRVKIIAYICAEAVFQILDPAYFHLGELQWVSDDAKYDHVFHSFLGCTDIDYLDKLAAPTVIGKELDILLIDANRDNNCAVCKATLGNAPKTKLQIKFKLDGCN